MFYFTRDVTPATSLDTFSQEFVFHDSLMQTATYTTASDSPEYESSYQGLVFNYDTDRNVVELGWRNTYREYNIHMSVTSVDNKKNPVYHASPIAYVLGFSRIDPELTMSRNNISDITYSNGEVAELEYTYNEQGFPLTVKNGGENFFRYEYTYRIE